MLVIFIFKHDKVYGCKNPFESIRKFSKADCFFLFLRLSHLVINSFPRKRICFFKNIKSLKLDLGKKFAQSKKGSSGGEVSALTRCNVELKVKSGKFGLFWYMTPLPIRGQDSLLQSALVQHILFHPVQSSKRFITDLRFIQRNFNKIWHSCPTSLPLNPVLKKVDCRPAIPVTVNQEGAGWMRLTTVMRLYF